MSDKITKEQKEQHNRKFDEVVYSLWRKGLVEPVTVNGTVRWYIITQRGREIDLDKIDDEPSKLQ